MEDGGHRALELKSDDDHSTIAKEVDVDLGVTPILEWAWRAIAHPAGADLTKKATSDVTGHIFVVWPRFPAMLRSQLIGYIWDPLLPAGSCDLILIVDTYHHFPDGTAYLTKLAAALKPGGTLVNIDYHKRELPVGPSVDHLVDREDFLKDAEAAGLRLVSELTFLPHQYFLHLAPK